MNIDELTIGQAKDIATQFGGNADKSREEPSPNIGSYVILRTYASGVHAGYLENRTGRTVQLSRSRRLWRFDVAPHGIETTAVALHGSPGKRSKICEEVASIEVLDALEIIPATEKARMQIQAAPVATPE